MFTDAQGLASLLAYSITFPIPSKHNLRQRKARSNYKACRMAAKATGVSRKSCCK